MGCGWCGYEKDTPGHELGCGVDVELQEGVTVFKRQEYAFPGTIVSVFQTLAGGTRLVVESELLSGMLHIFSPSQMRPNEYEMLCEKRKPSGS